MKRTGWIYVLAAIAAVLYLCRFAGLNQNLSDFFGGMAVGLIIAGTIATLAGRV